MPRTSVGRKLAILWLRLRLRLDRRTLARAQRQLDPLLYPHLAPAEFRAIYTGVGGAGIVAGIAVMANWVSIVQAAGGPSALQVAGGMFYVGLAVVVLGIYCFVASMSSSRWLWLPGKGSMWRAAESLAIRTEFHSVSVATLAFARVAGMGLRELADPSVKRVAEWYRHVIRLSVDVWGESGMQVVTLIGLDEKRSWTRTELISEVLNPTLLKIEAIIASISAEQITSSVDKGRTGRLREEFDYFRTLWHELSATDNASEGVPELGAGDVATH